MPLNQPIRDLRNLRVWIVGASTGIGAALADKLAVAGARVAVSSRRKDALETIASRYTNGKVLAVPLDITDSVQWQNAVDEVTAAFGTLDLVVLMAGDYKPMRAWDLNAADAEKLINVNFTGIVRGLALLLPILLKQKSGHLSLVASVAGYRGLPKSLIYGPTKAALINLAEVLYLDLHAAGVGVSVVNPGFVKTPLTDQNDFKMPALITPEEAADNIIAGLAAGRFEIHFPKRFTRWLKFLRVLPYGLYFAAIRRFINTTRP